jgi:two-component system chemotaxis response regulator CheB
MAPPAIIVMGASAGGFEPLREIVHSLDASIPAAVFIVRHQSALASAELPKILAANSSLPIASAANNEPIEPGRAYVAPPDRHLVLRDGRMFLEFAARVNYVRPSIDVLFRSAARAFGDRVVGVVLSGALDDGATGLLAIKRAGGMAIVQSPEEAIAKSMPATALRYVDADHVASASQIGPLLVTIADRLAHQETSTMNAPTDRSQEKIDSDLAEQERGDRSGEISTFSCPECGGILWQIPDERPIQFRCHVGHGYIGKKLLEQKADDVERLIWSLIRGLKEVGLLSTELAREARAAGVADSAAQFERHARDAERQLMNLEAQLLRPPRRRLRTAMGDRLAPGDGAPEPRPPCGRTKLCSSQRCCSGSPDSRPEQRPVQCNRLMRSALVARADRVNPESSVPNGQRTEANKVRKLRQHRHDQVRRDSFD